MITDARNMERMERKKGEREGGREGEGKEEGRKGRRNCNTVVGKVLEKIKIIKLRLNNSIFSPNEY